MVHVRHFGFLAPNAKVPLQKVRALICTLHEIIAELLPEKKACAKEALDLYKVRRDHPLAGVYPVPPRGRVVRQVVEFNRVVRRKFFAPAALNFQLLTTVADAAIASAATASATSSFNFDTLSTFNSILDLKKLT